MIGDTGAGTCLTIAGPSTFAIEHPTLTCSRLNVSENNTPVPTDRTFISYRHFKNVTDVRVLTAFQRDYNVDRFTIGTERTFLDGMGSLELRLPLERRITSNFGTFVSGGVDFLDDNDIIEPFNGERQNELGNVAAMLKMLMISNDKWNVSAGLGVTVPTARDFTYVYHFDALFYEDDIFAPFDGAPDTFRYDTEDFGIEITNETVFLSPYMAWLWQPKGPKSRFFHQGFCQIEIAANTSNATVTGSGSIELFDDITGFPVDVNDVPEGVNVSDSLVDIFFFPTDGNNSSRIHAQTLLRLNLGCGYILTENQNSCLKRLTSLFELHYTQTLQDPNRSNIPLEVTDGLGNPITLTPELEEFFDNAFTIGNPLNSSSIVNAVAGLSANIGDGNTVVTSGLIFPLSQGDDHAFDLEYNLQVQRMY